MPGALVDRVGPRPRGHANAEFDLEATLQSEPSLRDDAPFGRSHQAHAAYAGQPVLAVDIARRELGEQDDINVRVAARPPVSPRADECKGADITAQPSPPGQTPEDRLNFLRTPGSDHLLNLGGDDHWSVSRPLSYSHSMVPGGLLVTSSTTRFTSRTSLVMRVEIFSSTSYGTLVQSAVIASSDDTGRSTIGWP